MSFTFCRAVVGLGVAERETHPDPRQWSGVRTVLSVLAVLGALGGAPVSAQTAFDPLLQQLRAGRASQRIEALRALQVSGYPALFDAIAPLVTDPDNSVQLEAIDTVLTALLAPAPSARAARPFTVQNGSIAESVFESLPLAVLPRQVPPTVSTTLLAATRDDDQRVRIAAAFALGVVASPAIGPRTADVERALVSELPQDLRHPDPATREALVRAIGRIFEPPPHASCPSAIGDAVIAALNDPDERVRLWANDTLGWLREARAVAALTDRLTFYKQGIEAWAALHALARIAQPESAAVLRQYLAAREPEPRVEALEGLGRLRDPANVASIRAALGDERSPSVLLAGAFAYWLLGGRANLDALMGALVVSETTHQARVYLTELGADAAPDLRAGLQRPDPALRQAVAEVLGLSGDQGSLPALEAAARDPEPAVAEAVRQALVRLRTLPAGVRVH